MPRKRYGVDSDAERKSRADRHKDRPGRRPFAGIDGEGGTREGVHHYFYLRAGDRDLYNGNGDPLNTVQCLEFLATLPVGYTYVGFFFDYDVTMILRDLPLERVGQLLHPRTYVGRDGRKHTSGVDWNGYQLTYRQGKEFCVRKLISGDPFEKGSKATYTRWTRINDVGSFFQCTFVRALCEWLGRWDSVSDDYVIDDLRDRRIVERIAEGKLQRNEFTGLTEYIKEYCQLECEQLARVMEIFRGTCTSVGLAPTRWQGPGYLVSAAMRKHGFPKNADYKALVPDRIWELANSAYYGGRFEAPIIGEIPGPVYQYDINSAYAGVYQYLPCLLHGQWHRTDVEAVSRPLVSLVHVRYVHKPGRHICALPVRDKNGRIYFPHKGQGVYWWFEVTSDPGAINVEVLESWSYTSNCDCTPFHWIDALYHERMRVGKKTGKGAILKLVLASTYGKLCQSIGEAPYSNPVWASLITAYVRTQLYKAAVSENDGRDVVMLATDGLFTRRARDGLRVSGEIGEWESDIHGNMFVIQSGLYFLPDKKPKTRGIPRANIEKQRVAIIESWKHFLPTLRKSWHPRNLAPASCPVFVSQFISLSQGYAWGNMKRAGVWLQDHERSLSFDWRSKRSTGIRARVVGNALYTTPHTGSRGDPNYPYSKSIGGMVDGNDGPGFRAINDGQPDWNHFSL